MTPILDSTKRWQCPSCGTTHVTNDPRPVTPMHPCPSLSGLLAPFVEAGSDAHHVVNVREDYAGDEHGLVYADGRPVSSISTVYADGHNDLNIFAPTAVAGGTSQL